MAFTGNYDEYFGMSTDADAVVYLMLMNSMVHDLFPHAITVGEDVSGMPSFCRCGPLPPLCRWRRGPGEPATDRTVRPWQRRHAHRASAAPQPDARVCSTCSW